MLLLLVGRDSSYNGHRLCSDCLSEIEIRSVVLDLSGPAALQSAEAKVAILTPEIFT
jgi:hypothetical protein